MSGGDNGVMVMPAQNAKGIVHYYAGKFPGSVGWIMSPDGWRVPPKYMPYALDNGAYKHFNPDAFRSLLRKAQFCDHKPLFVVLPDVVADSAATLELWHQWKDEVQSYGYRLAFACQNGQEPENVPAEAYACFIGGDTRWKLNNAGRFKGVRRWLHIGRVNTARRLAWAYRVGADSVDGTGYFRGDRSQVKALCHFIENRRQEFLV